MEKFNLTKVKNEQMEKKENVQESRDRVTKRKKEQREKLRN